MEPSEVVTNSTVSALNGGRFGLGLHMHVLWDDLAIGWIVIRANMLEIKHFKLIPKSLSHCYISVLKLNAANAPPISIIS